MEAKLYKILKKLEEIKNVCILIKGLYKSALQVLNVSEKKSPSVWAVD